MAYFSDYWDKQAADVKLIIFNLDSCASTQRIIMGLSTAIHSDGDLSYDELDRLQMMQYILCTDLIFQKLCTELAAVRRLLPTVILSVLHDPGAWKVIFDSPLLNEHSRTVYLDS